MFKTMIQFLLFVLSFLACTAHTSILREEEKSLRHELLPNGPKDTYSYSYAEKPKEKKPKKPKKPKEPVTIYSYSYTKNPTKKPGKPSHPKPGSSGAGYSYSYSFDVSEPITVQKPVTKTKAKKGSSGASAASTSIIVVSALAGAAVFGAFGYKAIKKMNTASLDESAELASKITNPVHEDSRSQKIQGRSQDDDGNVPNPMSTMV